MMFQTVQTLIQGSPKGIVYCFIKLLYAKRKVPQLIFLSYNTSETTYYVKNKKKRAKQKY